MKNYKRLFRILFAAHIVLIASCNASTPQVTAKGDSSNPISQVAEASHEDDDNELEEIYSSFLQNYNDSIHIDTTFVKGDSLFEISFRHYCLFDSAVTVPNLYTKIYNLDSFVTHSFVSTLKVKVGDVNVLDTLINKSVFVNKLPEYLQNYGVLLSPDFHLDDSGFVRLDYSISVPLTDVGEPFIYKYKL
jgi:hypothetical protein